MTDYNALAGGIDISHNNGKVDWGKVEATRPAFVVIKATERMWVDPEFATNRDEATKRNIPWLPYPFIRPDDNDATIKHFAAVVGQKGIPPALDWEVAGVSSAVIERWIDGSVSECGRIPLAYYGISPPAVPTPKIGTCPRWYPQYPGSAAAPPRLPMWDGKPVTDWRTRWLIWQWSEKGRVDGITTNVDLDRLACSPEDFMTWYATGTLPTHGDLVTALAPIPTAITHRTLRLNSTGDEVRALQLALESNGYATGGVDSIFGRHTLQLVQAFQSAKGLKSDGIVGPATWAALGP